MCAKRKLDAYVCVRMLDHSIQMCGSKATERIMADSVAQFGSEHTCEAGCLLRLIGCYPKGLGGVCVGLPGAVPREDSVTEVEHVLCCLPNHYCRVA